MGNSFDHVSANNHDLDVFSYLKYLKNSLDILLNFFLYDKMISFFHRRKI